MNDKKKRRKEVNQGWGEQEIHIGISSLAHVGKIQKR